jgi:hypothetical protein
LSASLKPGALTAPGIENGKTIILETQDNHWCNYCFRHCKSRKREFEIKGKVTEPSFHTIQLESVAGKPYTKILLS